jgi:hypothetical protein
MIYNRKTAREIVKQWGVNKTNFNKSTESQMKVLDAGKEKGDIRKRIP